MRDPQYRHPDDDPFDEMPDTIWYDQDKIQPDEDTEWVGSPDEFHELAERWPFEKCSRDDNLFPPELTAEA